MGPGLILPGTLLLMLLLGLSTVHGTGGRIGPPAPHFLAQAKGKCRFANGSAGEVRYLQRYFYGRQEVVRFDSRRGVFEALSPLGEAEATYWNGQKEVLEDARAQVDRLCRYNYRVSEEWGLLTRKVKPLVRISHTKAGPLAHQTLLICTAAGYYPSEVNFKWLKNGEEQAEGLGYADELQNGDWTYQNQVLLETVPEWGDVYACQVEHSSLEEPITVLWEPRMSDSSRSKMWTGGVGALLGVVFGAVAVSIYLKNNKAAPAAPAPGLIS